MVPLLLVFRFLRINYWDFSICIFIVYNFNSIQMEACTPEKILAAKSPTELGINIPEPGMRKLLKAVIENRNPDLPDDKYVKFVLEILNGVYSEYASDDDNLPSLTLPNELLKLGYPRNVAFISDSYAYDHDFAATGPTPQQKKQRDAEVAIANSLSNLLHNSK